MSEQRRLYGERRYYLRLGPSGVIREAVSTDAEAFAHIQETAGAGVVEVDEATQRAAVPGGKYVRSTKKLTAPPPVSPPEGVTVIK
jgi:hypothetical protein